MEWQNLNTRLRYVILSVAKNLCDYLRDPSLLLRVTCQSLSVYGEKQILNLEDLSYVWNRWIHRAA